MKQSRFALVSEFTLGCPNYHDLNERSEGPLKAGIDRFAFECEPAKDALVYTAKRLLANEPF